MATDPPAAGICLESEHIPKDIDTDTDGDTKHSAACSNISVGPDGGDQVPQLNISDKPRSQYGSFLSTRSKLYYTREEDRPLMVASTDTKEVPVPIYMDNSDDDSEAADHWFMKRRTNLNNFCSTHSKLWKYIILTVLFLAYCVYFAFAIRYNLDNAKALVVITGLVCLAIVYVFIRDHFGDAIYRGACNPANKWLSKRWYILQWFVYPALAVGVVLYLSLVVVRSMRQLQPLLGMAVFIFIPIITSKYPSQIKWRPVLWGFAFQFIIGILVMRWETGFNAIRFLSNEIQTFLFYSLEGAAAVFGDPAFFLHPFLSVVVSLIVYIGAVVGIMYHAGVTQLIAQKVGWFMQITLQTTAIESISLAVNIFLSVLETILMLKSYFPLLTPSEFHCFLVGSHSTIAGFAFGLFVLFGVSPQHLLTGAVMSAPAAVAVSKMNWPETEESRLKNLDDVKMNKGMERNWIEAAYNGAWNAGKSVAAITLQVIAFMSLYFFADATVMWLGARVGIVLSIPILFGWIFTPVAFLLGVDWEDLNAVGRLLGLKVVANEFLGYILLGMMNRRREISKRSAAIATYAMCGFSSFGTLAMFVGVWVSVDKKKTSTVVNQIPRIMLNSNIACFLTACIAGLFYSEDIELQDSQPNPGLDLVLWILGLLPSARELLTPLGIIP